MWYALGSACPICVSSTSGAVCVRGPRVFSDARYSARAPAAHVACPFGSHMYRLRVHLRGKCASGGCVSSLMPGIPPGLPQLMWHAHSEATCTACVFTFGEVCIRGLCVISAARRSGRANPAHDFMKPRQCVPTAFPAFRPRQHRSAVYPFEPACTACVFNFGGSVRPGAARLLCCPAFRPHPHSPGGISRRARMFRLYVLTSGG